MGKLAKWQIWLSEFDIVYVTQKAVKGQALAYHLAENLVDEEYEPLKMYFPDEEVSFVGEDITKAYDGWRMFFDGAANFKGVGIGTVLVSKIGKHYPVSAKLRFPCTNNIAVYEACILGLRLTIDMNIQELLVIGDSDLLVHQGLGERAMKNTKILPYLHCVQELIKSTGQEFYRSYPNKDSETVAYCAHVEEEIDGNPWFHDIKKYLEKGEYPEIATHTQKRMLRRLANHFFQIGGILYIRTHDLGLLGCVDAKKASRFLEEIHVVT
ncbi:uncharacterized protein [Nicotiana tomentosiformis]|uniref:uncharacterized protein n=1 Tax=Nicotiana tomentosiformis TaxID=4098 RepID=UPI00388C9C4A